MANMSALMRENEELRRNLEMSKKNVLILNKEMEEWKRVNGEMMIGKSEAESQVREVQYELGLVGGEVERLRRENGVLEKEGQILKKQLVEVRKEERDVAEREWSVEVDAWKRKFGDIERSVEGLEREWSVEVEGWRRKVEELERERRGEVEGLKEVVRVARGEKEESERKVREMERVVEEMAGAKAGIERKWVEKEREMERLVGKEVEKEREMMKVVEEMAVAKAGVERKLVEKEREMGRLAGKEVERRLVEKEREMMKVVAAKEVLEKRVEEKEKEVESVLFFATTRYKAWEQRLKSLEDELVLIQAAKPAAADTAKEPGSPDSDMKTEVLSSHSASETTLPQHEPISSMHCVSNDKSVQAPPLTIIELSDSDDCEVLTPSEGKKRKYLSYGEDMGAKDEVTSRENTSKQLKVTMNESAETPPLVTAAGIGGNRHPHMKLIGKSKNVLAPLRPCVNKPDHGVESSGKHHSTIESLSDSRGEIQDESSGSNKEWEYIADMLEAFRKDVELCMQAMCALYRQQAFTDGIRGIQIAKFLVNGDASKRMTRSVPELQEYGPKAADDCRRIAFGHAKQLFDIYTKKKDPYFCP